MPISRFPSGNFPEFCQFRMKKKDLAIEMKNFYHFPYSLMHIRPFDEISMFQGNNKNIRTRLKSKVEN